MAEHKNSRPLDSFKWKQGSIFSSMACGGGLIHSSVKIELVPASTNIAPSSFPHSSYLRLFFPTVPLPESRKKRACLRDQG